MDNSNNTEKTDEQTGDRKIIHKRIEYFKKLSLNTSNIILSLQRDLLMYRKFLKNIKKKENSSINIVRKKKLVSKIKSLCVHIYLKKKLLKKYENSLLQHVYVA